MVYSMYPSITPRSDPKFPKTLIGDFTFDSERNQHRSQLFLRRNMTRVLAYHEKNRIKAAVNSNLHRRRTFGGSIDSVSTKSGAETPTANGAEPATPLVLYAGQNLIATSQALDMPIPPGRQHLPSVSESVSPSAFVVASPKEDYKAPARRSLRRLEGSQYDDEDAELRLNLSNIRKKLNFMSNMPSEEDRPNKRQKRESIKCQCHLTVWDNREGLEAAEPLIRKSQMCQVIATERGAIGWFVDIELDGPFIIKARELKVSTDRKGESVLGMVDKYFLELKIVPSRLDIQWPPIPILGKSDGDHFTGLGKTASEKLQGALVARYMHLPQAPAADVPLSIFFLREGRTYRTKYGLEVNSQWAKSHGLVHRVKPEPKLDPTLGSWIWDPEGQPFGRRRSTKSNKSNPVADGRPAQHPRDVEVKITYTFDASSIRPVAKEFRRATVTGFCCPACPLQKSSTLEDLQFHFHASHAKYRFIIEKKMHDAANEDDLTYVHFRVGFAEAGKPRTLDKAQREEEFEWHAPAEPFDQSAYVNGDQSWLGVQSKKRGPSNGAASNLTLDPRSLLRKKNGGFLPAEHVPDFRQTQRKKYPVTTLRMKTKGTTKETMYSSISHRPLRLSEEPRSETDDEMDDDWFVERHMETLELTAEQEGWSDEERELLKRWNKHRLEEHLEHPRFLSDSLVRFVRKNKTWLKNGNAELLRAFFTLIGEFKGLRVLNDAVVMDLHRMIFGQMPISMGQAGDGESTIDVSMADVSPTAHQGTQDAQGIQDIHVQIHQNLNGSSNNNSNNSNNSNDNSNSNGKSNWIWTWTSTGIKSTTNTTNTNTTNTNTTNTNTTNTNTNTTNTNTNTTSTSTTNTTNTNTTNTTNTNTTNTNTNTTNTNTNTNTTTNTTNSTNSTNTNSTNHHPQQQQHTTRQTKVETLLSIAPGCCGACSKPIARIIKKAIRCSEAQCETAAVMYHARCVKQDKQDKLAWTCDLCKERIREIKGKGKVRD